MAAPRSTLRLLETVHLAEDTGEVPVLTGNTGDVFAAPDGSVYRIEHLLAHDAADRGMALVIFSLARGSRQLNPGGRAAVAGLRHVGIQDGQASAATDLLDQLAVLEQPVRLVVDFADLFLPADQAGDPLQREQERIIELLAGQAQLQAAGSSRHRLLLLVRGGAVDERLLHLPGMRPVPVPLPDTAERAALIQQLRNPRVGRPLQLADDLDARLFARLSGGLSGTDLLQGRAMAQTTGTPVDRSWVQERKSVSMARAAGDSLLVYQAGSGMADVAGLPQIRLLLQEARTTGRLPRRIMLVGPPGVGKTLVVRAIADELGLPAVALGNFRNMYVGETERRLRVVLQTLTALAPCVLHIDEFDQSIGQRTTGQSADGGTSERVLAELWTFLGENTGDERVVVIATSNRPDLLDTAMFDRFLFIPVLHPTPSEAAEVMRIAARREGRDLDGEEARRAVAGYGRLVTGRVLVDVTDRAMTLADMRGDTLAGQHLEEAFGDLMAALDQGEHEHLALQALAVATFQSHLPWVAARRLGLEPHVPGYAARLIDPATGRLDRDRLAGALRQR